MRQSLRLFRVVIGDLLVWLRVGRFRAVRADLRRMFAGERAGFVPLVAASGRLVRSDNVCSVVAVSRGVLMFSGQRPGVGP